MLPLSIDDDVPELEDFSEYDKMMAEYKTLGIYPKGHLMEFVRPQLRPHIVRTDRVERAKEGQEVEVAGWAIARQHPRGEEGTVFVTIEDEMGDVQLILWPQIFARYRQALKDPVLLVKGKVSRWDGTTNIIVSELRPIRAAAEMPRSHDWH